MEWTLFSLFLYLPFWGFPFLVLRVCSAPTESFFSDYNISCEYKKKRKKNLGSFLILLFNFFLNTLDSIPLTFLSIYLCQPKKDQEPANNLSHSDQPQRNTQFSSNTLFLKASFSSPHKHTLLDGDGDGEWKCLLSFLLDYIFVKLSVQDICINVIKKILRWSKDRVNIYLNSSREGEKISSYLTYFKNLLFILDTCQKIWPNFFPPTFGSEWEYVSGLDILI